VIGREENPMNKNKPKVTRKPALRPWLVDVAVEHIR